MKKWNLVEGHKPYHRGPCTNHSLNRETEINLTVNLSNITLFFININKLI